MTDFAPAALRQGSIYIVTASQLLERFVKSSTADAPGHIVVLPTVAEAAERSTREGVPALLVIDYYLDSRDAHSVIPEALQYDELEGAPILLIYPPSVEREAKALAHTYSDRVTTLAKPFTTLGFFVKARPYLPDLRFDAAGADGALPAVHDLIDERPASAPFATAAPTQPQIEFIEAPAVESLAAGEAWPSPPVFELPPEPASVPLPMSGPPSSTRYQIIAAIPEVTDLFQWGKFGDIEQASNDSMQAVSDGLAFALQLAVRVGSDCQLGDVLELQIAGPSQQAGLLNLEGRGAHDASLATFGFVARPNVPVEEIIRRIRRDCE